MDSLPLSTGIARRRSSLRAELAALRADVAGALLPMVTRYWKAALAALAGAGSVLTMLQPPEWVVRGTAWATVLGFFVALTVAWVRYEPPEGRPRRGKGRFVAVLAALVLSPVLLVGAVTVPQWLPQVRPPGDVSLALLTSTQDPLSRGLAEELRSHLLTSGAELVVLPPGDRERQEPPGASMAEIGRGLQATDVLELIVQHAEARLMVTVHLWDSRTERMVWTERYDKTGDIFDVQLQIAEQIARELGLRLTPAQQVRLATAPTANDDAYLLYLEGRGLLYPPVRTLEGNDQALRRFREALRLDPGFGLAYAGLARGYGVRAQLTGVRLWHDSAIAAAQKAVQLAPREERSHAALGVVLREAGRFEAALAALREAEALSPEGGDGSGRSNLGLVMTERGFLGDGVRYGEQAVEIEPRSPTAQWRLGMTYELLGDDPRAEQRFREAVQVAPNSPEARFRLAMLFWARGESERGDPELSGFGAGAGWCQVFQWESLNGRPARARAQLQAQREGAWRCAPVLQALVYRQLGDEAGARAALDTAEAAARDSIASGHDGSHPRLVLAQVHALRGDVGEANRWFTQAVEHGYLHVRQARRLATLAALRGTPEFERNLRSMESAVLRQRQQLEAGGDSAGAAPPPR